MDLRALGLFAGIGGLELGVQLGCGARTVCYVERDAYAAATLVARMADETLDSAPVWDDVATFDGRPWRGAVDLVCGGFPCQDISVAGKGEGLDGSRSGLWSEYARIVREVRPRYVFVENVAALSSRGLDQVLVDLAALGFNAEWDVFSAGAVGAPHKRERLFILAWRVPDAERDDIREESGWRFGGRDRPASRVAGDVGEELAEPGRGAGGARIAGETVGDSDRRRREGQRQQEHPHECGAHRRTPHGSASHRGQLWPPGPSDAEGWLRYIKAGGPEPSICRGADGAAARLVDRADRLRCLGNGVVPVVAARALRTLAARAGIDIE